MTTTLEALTREALALPVRQRLVLARVLLETTDACPAADTDATWEREIQERITAVDSGSVTGIPWHQVVQKAEQRLAL